MGEDHDYYPDRMKPNRKYGVIRQTGGMNMSTHADKPRDRDEILARMATSREAMLALFDQLGDAALTGPQDAAGWNAKDHFYHLAAWRQIQLARLRGEPEYAAVGLPDQANYDTLCDSEDFQAINEYIAGRGRALPPAEVRAEYVEADDALRGEIERRDFASLFAETRSDASEGGPLVDSVIGNTYEHDPDHQAYILRIVGEQ